MTHNKKQTRDGKEVNTIRGRREYFINHRFMCLAGLSHILRDIFNNPSRRRKVNGTGQTGEARGHHRLYWCSLALLNNEMSAETSSLIPIETNDFVFGQKGLKRLSIRRYACGPVPTDWGDVKTLTLIRYR